MCKSIYVLFASLLISGCASRTDLVNASIEESASTQPIEYKTFGIRVWFAPDGDKFVNLLTHFIDQDELLWTLQNIDSDHTIVFTFYIREPSDIDRMAQAIKFIMSNVKKPSDVEIKLELSSKRPPAK